MSRHKREREAPEVGAMAGRVIRALVRRAAEGDTEALEQLLSLETQLAQAIKDAGRALHDDAGYSFTYLAGVAGVSRQAARERFGRPAIAPHECDDWHDGECSRCGPDTPTLPAIPRPADTTEHDARMGVAQ